MKTILLVDDRPDSRYVTARTLNGAGYDVRETGSGRDALRLARTLPADLIVLDVALPDLDGFEVCRQLKADRVTGPIPVIHKTAVYLDPDARRQGFAVGADEFLTEPVEGDLLLRAVERLLERVSG